jgi:adenylate cyclase
MQTRLKELNVEFKKRNRPELKVGIGVNTGIMNVGDMGSEFRRAYTVLSDSVNLASRLENLTRLYSVEIIVGENTWKQTKDDFVYRLLDRVKVKGKDKAVDIYEPLCYTTNASKEILNKLSKHDEALNLYRKREWEKATKSFQELQKSSNDDAALYEVYLERIRNFRVIPPESGWDGTYTLEKK